MDDGVSSIQMDISSPVIPLKKRRRSQLDNVPTSSTTSTSTSTSISSMSTTSIHSSHLNHSSHSSSPSIHPQQPHPQDHHQPHPQDHHHPHHSRLNTSSSSSSNTSRTRGKSGERVNPFEPFCLRNMKASIFSPSVFLTSTPTTKMSEGFNGWDVNELAELFPKSLENSPTSHTNPYPIDPRMEARAQEDITEFFNQGPIAPTPDDVPKRAKNYLYRSPQAGQGHQQHQQHQGETSRFHWGQQKRDSWTNTVLSFPTDETLPLELEAMLAPYFTVECCSETEIKISSGSMATTPAPPPQSANSWCGGGRGVNGGDNEDVHDFDVHVQQQKEDCDVDEDDRDLCLEEGFLDEGSQGSRVDRSQQMSVRRRLELSFGETSTIDADGGSGSIGNNSPAITPIRGASASNTTTTPRTNNNNNNTPNGFRAYGDPFGDNREIMSPVQKRPNNNTNNNNNGVQTMDSKLSN